VTGRWNDLARGLVQYLFWVFLLLTVGVVVVIGAGHPTAFRYMGF
jgi:hypothetical protein